MIVDIYVSTSNGDLFLTVPENTDVTKLDLPLDDYPDLRNITPFKTSLELDPSEPRMGIDQETIFRQINDSGFAIHGASMDISIGLRG